MRLGDKGNLSVAGETLVCVNVSVFLLELFGFLCEGLWNPNIAVIEFPIPFATVKVIVAVAVASEPNEIDGHFCLFLKGFRDLIVGFLNLDPGFIFLVEVTAALVKFIAPFIEGFV